MGFHLYEDTFETTTTTGAGDLALDGAVVGWRAFSAQYVNSDTFAYSLYNGVDFEHGIGTYNAAANTISRTTVLRSTNSGNAVNFGSGVKNVVVAPLGVLLETFLVPGQFANTTQTNDNAGVGCLGEYLSGSGTATFPDATTPINIASVVLEDGDWDVDANISTSGASVSFNAWISTTSAADPGFPNAGAYCNSTIGYIGFVGRKRVSLAASATVFLSAKLTSAGTGTTGSGFIRARRVR
jgi:hypothetical protein